MKQSVYGVCPHRQKTVALVKKGKEKEFFLRGLCREDINDVLLLQGEVINHLENKELLQPSTEEEIAESTEKDFCFGVYDNHRLAAFAIAVVNRECDRNLSADWADVDGKNGVKDYLTFDTVQVHPEYRGYGMQRLLLERAEELAAEMEVKYIAATVSPHNRYSLDNFISAGYYLHPGKSPYIKYGKERYLVRKNISSNTKKGK